MRKLKLNVGLLLALVGVFSVYWIVVAESRAVTQENVDRIKEGMSVEEVEQLLGRRVETTVFLPEDGTSESRWNGDRGWCVVFFQDGKALAWWFYEHPALSVWETTLIRLGFREPPPMFRQKRIEGA